MSNGPPSTEAFLAQQKADGLRIDDEQRARRQLQCIGTFRFQEYAHELRAPQRYSENATFEAVMQLHDFDEELRLVVFHAIEHLEVALRALLDGAYQADHGQFWHLKTELFELRGARNLRAYGNLLGKFAKGYQHHDAPFITEYRKSHGGKYAPASMQLAISTFGSLSFLFDLLKSTPYKRTITDFFGLSEDTLVSWLHVMVCVRNVCGHHGRLWNRQLSIWPLLPRNPAHIFLRQPGTHTNTVYHALGILRYLLEALGKGETFLADTLGLLEAYPGVERARMGFPPAWRDEPLWNPGPLPSAPPKPRRRTPKGNRG